MPRLQKKYHYIYKTTCKMTGKFYVGMHSTDDINDGYLGSGKILGYSRKKYGDENHVREILEMLPSREALKAREKEIVNEQLLANPLNINLKYGGDGGQTSAGSKSGWTDEQRRLKQSARMSSKLKDSDYLSQMTSHSSDTMKKTHAAGKINYATFTGRKHSEETKAKMKASHAKRKQKY